MEAAKASVKKFMSKDGRHDTEIHEQVAPAVQNETVIAKQHEQQTTAVDREVHQDHYHTSVQPVKHQEVLPEQHHHNLKEVEHRSFEHDDHDQVKSRLAQEQSQIRDTSQRVEGERTTAAAPVVGGEHVHHHVHETIQPVVHKQTIEPHVVHTTVPVHEVHHNAAQHHQATSLPPVSMDDFKKQGGSLSGRETVHDKFDGCPPEHGERGVDGRCGHASHRDGAYSTTGTLTSGTSSQIGHESSRATRDNHDTGPEQTISSQSNASKGPLNSHKSDGVSSDSLRNKNTTSGTTSGLNSGNTNNGLGGNPNSGASHVHPTPASYGNDMHVKTKETSGSKPSLMDKLNPKKDADGDGKPGFMK